MIRMGKRIEWVLVGTALALTIGTGEALAFQGQTTTVAHSTAWLINASTLVRASADDGNIPSNTLDGDPLTRWSAEGDGQWIQYDLGQALLVKRVDIAFFRGGERRSYFDIEVSNNAEQWDRIYSGESVGDSDGLESFRVPTTVARYVRIVGWGNSINRWISLTEVQIPAEVPVLGADSLVARAQVVASEEEAGNEARNTIDGSLGTRWSALGDGQWVAYDFGTPRQLAAIDIAFFRGDERRTWFDIEVSDNGEDWRWVRAGSGSGVSNGLERFLLPEPVAARHARVVGYGNELNDWNSLTQVQVPMLGSGVVAVVASADDGNVPTNVIDQDLSTRWSAEGEGQWIRLDMGHPVVMDGVDIAVFRGDERQAHFEIEVSANAQQWHQVAREASAGHSLQPERFGFEPTQARFLRIVGQGNSSNDWNSFTQITPRVAGQGDGEQTDRFGVTMKYPSKPGGEEWFLAEDATNDSRFQPQDPITRNSDGSWRMRSDKVRMNVFTSTGYSRNRIPTYDRVTLVEQGYMLAPNDWTNIEMTGFVRVNDADDWGDNLTWYARGGRHSSGSRNGEDIGCEGSSYKAGLQYDGRVRWQKESWHVNYDGTPFLPGTERLRGQWVGFKAVMRNTVVNGKPAVALESWLNHSGDGTTWELVYEVVDEGQIGGNSSHCGNVADAIPMTWGGPIAAFRWDGATSVDFKWLSVREIAN